MVILCPLIDTIDTSNAFQFNHFPYSPRLQFFSHFFLRHHHHHHHHHRKKRHKRKILVHDLDEQSVKVSMNVINGETRCVMFTLFRYRFVLQVIDPDDLSQRARWTIIATACLLLVMCLLLVGVTLRMAPLIDDMGEYTKPLPPIQ